MNDVPADIPDSEQLNRRIHPHFVKSDGSLSSQAFTDPSMSVDRAEYRSIEQSMHGYNDWGLAGFLALAARNLNQEVISVQELFNPAHALVEGKKNKRIARTFAKSSSWIVKIGEYVSNDAIQNSGQST